MSCVKAQKPRKAGAESSVSEARSTGKSIRREERQCQGTGGQVGGPRDMTGQNVPMGMTTQCRVEAGGQVTGDCPIPGEK